MEVPAFASINLAQQDWWSTNQWALAEGKTTLVQKGNAPMEFGAAFVENATRANAAVDPSTTTESITGFDVWGFMDSP